MHVQAGEGPLGRDEQHDHHHDEDVFFTFALSDLRRAADLFAPAHQRTDGVDNNHAA